MLSPLSLNITAAERDVLIKYVTYAIRSYHNAKETEDNRKRA